MSYEFILIDADGTLFDYDRAEAEAFHQTMLSYGLGGQSPVLLPLYQEINARIWKEFEKGLVSIEDIRKERFERLAAAAEINIPAVKVSEEYLAHLSAMAFLLEGAVEILSWLHKRSMLILITNGIADVQHKRIDKSGLADYFTHIVISEEVGAAKPDPAIFDHVFKIARCYEKKNAIIIGDSLSSDITGAVNYGIDSCWFNPDKLKNESEIEPTFEVSSLR